MKTVAAANDRTVVVSDHGLSVTGPDIDPISLVLDDEKRRTLRRALAGGPVAASGVPAGQPWLVYYNGRYWAGTRAAGKWMLAGVDPGQDVAGGAYDEDVRLITRLVTPVIDGPIREPGHARAGSMWLASSAWLGTPEADVSVAVRRPDLSETPWVVMDLASGMTTTSYDRNVELVSRLITAR